MFTKKPTELDFQKLFTSFLRKHEKFSKIGMHLTKKFIFSVYLNVSQKFLKSYRTQS